MTTDPHEESQSGGRAGTDRTLESAVASTMPPLRCVSVPQQCKGLVFDESFYRREQREYKVSAHSLCILCVLRGQNSSQLAQFLSISLRWLRRRRAGFIGVHPWSQLNPSGRVFIPRRACPYRRLSHSDPYRYGCIGTARMSSLPPRHLYGGQRGGSRTTLRGSPGRA